MQGGSVSRIGLRLVIGTLCAWGHSPGEWPVATAAQQGLSSAALARLDRHILTDLPHLRSLLIARNGRLVFEKYYGDASRDGLQNMQSMTKSVSSALVGIALKKGLIASLDSRVADYFPNYRKRIQDVRMKEITIRHILTMSSGIDEVRLSFDKALADPVAEILTWRLLWAPGHGFRYSSAAAHLLGGCCGPRAANPCWTSPAPSCSTR